MPHSWRRRFGAHRGLGWRAHGGHGRVVAGRRSRGAHEPHDPRRPGRAAAPGDPASVAGVLAGPPWCRDSQLITISDQDGVLGTTVTDARGHYLFDLIVESEMSVQASFAGLQQGQHPDRTICLPSESRWVRVRADKKAAASALAAVRGRHAELLRLV